jgi:putative ABC transport system permease protein
VLASATASFGRTLDRQMAADLYISSGESSGRPPTFDPAVLDRARAIPGVRSVAGEYYDEALIGGRRSGVTAVSDVPALVAALRLSTVEGELGRLGPDQFLVGADTARDRGIRVGSPVRFTFARGQARTMTLAGTYDSEWSGGWILPESVVPDLSVSQPSWGYLVLEPGAPAGDVRRQVDALLAESPEVTVVDRDGFLDQITGVFDTVLLMVRLLLALAMLIAVLGIVNTLALSVLERTRELGLLRAVGLDRRQATRMVTVEAVVISTFGALLGVAVGVGLGAAVVRALRTDGVQHLSLPWGSLAVYLLVGSAVGVVAALLPAVRAARVDVLRAISYE